MRIGIDASNLRRGGGVTHLIELLRAAETCVSKLDIVVWGSASTLSRIPDRPWILKQHEQLLDGPLLTRVRWQRFRLSALARQWQCEVLLVPGGSYSGDFEPVVTMSRNLLPFEWRELLRFRFSLTTVKLILLRLVQIRTFKRTAGVLFLTHYAYRTVVRVMGRAPTKSAIVPHGLSKNFFYHPRPQLPIDAYSPEQPFRILYVSIIDMYKHQWHVASAIALLRAAGFPVTLELIGPASNAALRRLQKARTTLDPKEEFITYQGAVPHDALPAHYSAADAFIFASSCENLPNILLEAMAAGMPIACSSRGPMPEVLADGGVYCDPEDPVAIAAALQALIESPALRTTLAMRAYRRALHYSWELCAKRTFGFLAEVARDN